MWTNCATGIRIRVLRGSKSSTLAITLQRLPTHPIRFIKMRWSEYFSFRWLTALLNVTCYSDSCYHSRHVTLQCLHQLFIYCKSSVRVLLSAILFSDWLISWVLWHINPCKLFNAKSHLYIQISNICFVN